jgi:lipid A 3-O-deacylase PagL
MAWRELSPQVAARNPRPAVLDCRSFSSSSQRQFLAAGRQGVHAALGRTGLGFGSTALFLLVIGATFAPSITNAQSLCKSCEAQIGPGATYHFWGPTGGLVLAATLSWDESRYELGVFRVARAQVLRDDTYREGRLMADPYWGVSLSRRWQLFQRGPVKGLFGFGLALKTESDQLSATRWDFASQLGLRFRIPGQLAAAELAVRHWSNAGIRLPNHGQDFVTLTFRLNTGRFGLDRAEQISLHPVVESTATLIAKNFDSEGSLP